MYLRVVKIFQCRRNHRIKHIVVGEVVSSHNRSRCHKFVNWLCRVLIFFDTRFIVRLWWSADSRTEISVEVAFSSFGMQCEVMPDPTFTRYNSEVGNRRIINHTTAEKRFHQIRGKNLSRLWKRGNPYWCILRWAYHYDTPAVLVCPGTTSQFLRSSKPNSKHCGNRLEVRPSSSW